MGVEYRFNVNDFAVCLTLKQRLGRLRNGTLNHDNY